MSDYIPLLNMPLTKGDKQVQIHRDLVVRLKSKWDERKKKLPQTNKTFNGFVNEVLSDFIEKDEFLQRYAPALSLESHSYNVLFIRDSKRQALAEVYRYDKKIKCALCNKFDCEHVHFALAIPEVAKLGLRKP
jgi:hypothetical protein